MQVSNKVVVVRDDEQKIDRSRLNCGQAETVIVLESVTKLRSGVFKDWKSLREVVFAGNSKLQTIGSEVFAGTGIERFEAPQQLKRIESSAFRGCKGLQMAILNDGLEVIGDNCFDDSSLRDIRIPGTVTAIGSNALNSCSHVTVFVAKDFQIDLQQHIKDYSVIAFPSAETTVLNAPLRDMWALSEVLLPAGLEEIEEGWFALSDIRQVTVPASVREIGKGAFACCRKLAEVCFEENSALEKLGSMAFA